MAASSPFRPFPPATPEANADADTDDTPAADATPFHARALAALEDALRSADARADAALALADKLASELADAGDRSERLARDLADANGDLSFIRAALDRTQAEARAARDRAEALQREDDARKARGLLARLRAAWRSE
jgi:chromosome segregation ATPase